MGTETEQSTQVHGGRLVARRLKAHGRHEALHAVRRPPLLDLRRLPGGGHRPRRHPPRAGRRLRRRGLGEGHAAARRGRAHRRPRGHERDERARRRRQQNGSPLVVLGGRAPAMRWGQGSLQEIDHVPFVAPADEVGASPRRRRRRSPGSSTRPCAPRSSRTRARPSWTSRSTSSSWRRPTARTRPPLHDPARRAGRRRAGLDRAVALLRGAERPVIMAGTGSTGATASGRCARWPRSCGIPVFLNGLARGAVPADHELFFSRARGTGCRGADVALVVGVPMDFRLAFGAGLRRGHRARRVDGRRAVRPHPRAGRGRAPRRRSARRSTRCASGAGAAGATRGWLDAAARGRGREAGGGAGAARATSARRCTRCGSTGSSARCSTATRS